MNRDDLRSPSRPTTTPIGVANPRRTRLSAAPAGHAPPRPAHEHRAGS